MHLVCFGDSICYGYGARPGEGWVAQMTRMLATLREPVAVTNAGVSGDTTEDGLRRMQWDVERHHPNAVFVQFGLNDASFWYTSVGRPLVGFRTYLANMGEIIQRSFRSGAAYRLSGHQSQACGSAGHPWSRTLPPHRPGIQRRAAGYLFRDERHRAHRHGTAYP